MSGTQSLNGTSDSQSCSTGKRSRSILEMDSRMPTRFKSSTDVFGRKKAQNGSSYYRFLSLLIISNNLGHLLFAQANPMTRTDRVLTHFCLLVAPEPAVTDGLSDRPENKL
jgi:hypothetical protein